MRSFPTLVEVRHLGNHGNHTLSLLSISHSHISFNTASTASQLLSETHSLDYSLDALSHRVAERLSENVCKFLGDPAVSEAAELASSGGILWGFKEPLAMFYLPLWCVRHAHVRHAASATLRPRRVPL